MWYLWGAQLVTGSNPGRYNRTIALPTSEFGLDYLPQRVGDYWQFDGTDEMWTIGEIPGDFSEMTVEIWWKTDRLRNWDNPIDCNFNVNNPANGTTPSGNIGPRLEINASGTLTWVWGSSVTANDPKFSSIQETITTGQWYHSVFTIDGPDQTGGRAYLNGNFTGVQTSTGTADWGQIGFIKNLVLGRGFAISGDRYFDGQIGEVRIYPRALTPAQVFQNYNATKTKYINEPSDTAPKIGPGIVHSSNLLINYDFGNRATYDTAQNLIRNSTDATSFTGYQRTITNNAALAPDGTMTAAKIAFNDTSGGADAVYYLDEVTNIPANNAGTYTYSVWLRGPDGFTGGAKIALLIQTGSNTEIQVDLTDEWQQYSVTKTYDGSFSTNIRIHPVIFRNVPGALDNGKLVPEFVYLWHPQLEKSSTTGRHVPTYGTMIQPPTTVKNLSSNSITGTINGPTFNPAGYFEFDGSTNVNINSNINTSLSGGTMEAWIWFNSINQDQGIFHIGSGSIPAFAPGVPHISFLINGSEQKIRWEVIGNPSTSWNTIVSSTTPNTGQWYHVVGTFDSANTTTLYLNGTQEAQQTNMSNQPTSVNNTLIVGEYLDTIDGRIGEARFYNRALSTTEVSQNYNATRGKYGV